MAYLKYSVTEVKAIVELLRKKTGDDSIDVAFFEEGSINMILSGSPEGLEKLKELFTSGELAHLAIPPVEAVHYIDNTTSSARKARLVKALQLKNSSIAFALDLALIHANNLSKNSSRLLEFTRTLASASALAIDLARALIIDLSSANPITTDLASASDRALDLARSLASAASYESNIDLNFARDLAQDLARNSVSANAPSHIHKIDLREVDLSKSNLRKIDLRQADLTETNFTKADLTGAILTEANLTGTDFTDANVTETVFGENPGLTEANKRDLQRRGAILLDPPSSDVPSLVPVG